MQCKNRTIPDIKSGGLNHETVIKKSYFNIVTHVFVVAFAFALALPLIRLFLLTRLQCALASASADVALATTHQLHAAHIVWTMAFLLVSCERIRDCLRS